MFPSLASIGEPRIYTACLVITLYVLFTCYFLRPRARTERSGARAADSSPVLVAFASQTGFAEQIALQTARALETAGTPAALISLADLELAHLDRKRALFIISTTGEGDAPDSAAKFVREALNRTASLAGLSYGVLALGDREYVNFCAFGHRLDQWLRRRGAHAMFDPVEVDNGDEGALRHWQHHLGLVSGKSIAAVWESPHYERWLLHERRLLNPDSADHACFHIELRPRDAQPRAWLPGDIAEIGPRSPSPQTASGPLPHREYSIASLPSDGGVHLLVRQMRQPTGELGLGSGWLTQHATTADDIDVRIRFNSNFRLPGDARPIIFIANGTGIAGLRSLLKARIADGHHRNWLIFGERNRSDDYYYADDIEGWRRERHIERVDLVFSRDQLERRYVHHRLLECEDLVRDWIDAGASIYVCGSLAGMAPGVDAALKKILGEAALDQLVEQGRYRRDVY